MVIEGIIQNMDNDNKA